MKIREVRHNIWLAGYTKLVACCTFLLIIAGGLVTSTDSGLSVPDWPLSFGQVFPPMVGGVFYEHGHRMVATLVGMLTVVMAIWLWKSESRRWLRNLGWIGLLAVITQGTLGGLTVLFLLPLPISVAHASLAQTFFCLMVSIAFFTSREWQESTCQLERDDSKATRVLCVVTVAAIYLQLVLGAVLRHLGAGLAIPDFPLAFGQLIPEFTDAKVGVHYAHRIMAVIVTAMIMWTATRMIRKYHIHTRFLQLAVMLLLLVILQVTLGAMTIWSRKDVFATTAHVANGALILAMGWMLTLYVFRFSSASAIVAMNQPAQDG